MIVAQLVNCKCFFACQFLLGDSALHNNVDGEECVLACNDEGPVCLSFMLDTTRDVNNNMKVK